jgi:hypothetical protein
MGKHDPPKPLNDPQEDAQGTGPVAPESDPGKHAEGDNKTDDK